MKTKNTSLVVATLVCLLSGSAMAHDKMGTSGRSMAIGYTPVTALFGAHILQFQFKMNDIVAPYVGMGLVDNRWSIKPEFNNQPGTFFEFYLGGKFFITGSPVDHGFFLENNFFFAYGKTPTGAQITSPYTAGPDQWLLGGRVGFGYEYVSDFGLFFDAGIQWVGYVGFGFPNSSVGLGDYDLRMWHPALNGHIGYAW